MPEIGVELTKIEKDSSISADDRLKKKEDLIREYTTKSQRIHSVNQLLKAYTLFEKDTEYIIVDGKV
jgi:preprotein translocase subunit SecA